MAKIIQKFNPLLGNFNQVTVELDGDEVKVTPAGNLTSTDTQSALEELQLDVDARELLANKGIANGYAPLNASSKIDVTYLPSNVMTYKGMWDGSTNTPTLADGVGTGGDIYMVSVAGTQDLGSGSLVFQVGDWIVYSGTVWEQSPSGDDVLSVHGRIGAVVSANGDYTASQVTNVASGNLAAVTVQAALNELQGDIDGITGSTALSDHIADTTTHGTVGNIVGTSDAQTLTNKTIDADLNTITDLADANIKSSAAIAGSKIDPIFASQVEAPGLDVTGQLIINTTVVAGTGSLVFDLLGDTSTFLVVYQTANGDELKLPSAAVDGRVIKVILSANSSGVPVSLLITSNGGNFGLDGSPSSYLLESAFQSLTFVSASNTWYIL